MFSELTVSDMSWAAKRGKNFDAVLSLHDTNLAPNKRVRFHKKPGPKHCTLLFDDFETEDEADELCLVLPQSHHVETALSFARMVEGNLLVHCHAGVSRSGALAFAMLADKLGPGHEQDALDSLLRVRPEAVPNGLVVRLADEALHRGGRLSRAYELMLSSSRPWQQLKEKQRASRRAVLD